MILKKLKSQNLKIKFKKRILTINLFMKINQKVNSKFSKMKQTGLLIILMMRLIKKDKFWKIKWKNMNSNKKKEKKKNIMKWKKIKNKRNKIKVQRNQKNIQMDMKNPIVKRGSLQIINPMKI